MDMSEKVLVARDAAPLSRLLAVLSPEPNELCWAHNGRALCAGWYFRMYTLVWVLKNRIVHVARPKRGPRTVFGVTVVPLLKRAAAGPRCPSYAGGSGASHSSHSHDHEFRTVDRRGGGGTKSGTHSLGSLAR